MPEIKHVGEWKRPIEYGGDLRILVMTKLSKNLENILKIYKEKNETMPLKKVLIIGYQVNKIIKVVHENNMIHRDIKPENFM